MHHSESRAGMQVESQEESKTLKGTLSSMRLQAMKGENGDDSAAPSVTDPGNQDDPASILEAMGEIASGRVDAIVKPEVSLPHLPLHWCLLLGEGCPGPFLPLSTSPFSPLPTGAASPIKISMTELDTI